MESINEYLLLRMVYSLISSVINRYNPIIYYFPAMVVENIPIASSISNFLYYEFVSLTTRGYGDVVPISSGAKSLQYLKA